MKRLALALALLVAAPAAHAGTPAVELHRKCLYPTAKVVAGPASGTAVIVRSRRDGDGWLNTAFTCEHVVRDVARPVVIIPRYRDWSRPAGSAAFDAEVVRSDRAADAAVLRFRGAERMPTAVVDWHPRLYIGNRVTKIGCGFGQAARADFGTVTGLDARLSTTTTPLFRLSVPTYAGDSGGPVFHERKLVAITHGVATRDPFGRDPVEMIGFAVPVAGAFKPGDLE